MKLENILTITLFCTLIFAFTKESYSQKIGLGSASYHTITVDNNGQVYTWGYNGYGNLGNGNTGTNSSNPVDISSSGALNGNSIILALLSSSLYSNSRLILFPYFK